MEGGNQEEEKKNDEEKMMMRRKMMMMKEESNHKYRNSKYIDSGTMVLGNLCCLPYSLSLSLSLIPYIVLLLSKK